MVVSLQSAVKKQVFYLALVRRQLVEVQLISKTNADGKKEKSRNRRTIATRLSKVLMLGGTAEAIQSWGGEG